MSLRPWLFVVSASLVCCTVLRTQQKIFQPAYLPPQETVIRFCVDFVHTMSNSDENYLGGLFFPADSEHQVPLISVTRSNESHKCEWRPSHLLCTHSLSFVKIYIVFAHRGPPTQLFQRPAILAQFATGAKHQRVKSGLFFHCECFGEILLSTMAQNTFL